MAKVVRRLPPLRSRRRARGGVLKSVMLAAGAAFLVVFTIREIPSVVRELKIVRM